MESPFPTPRRVLGALGPILRVGVPLHGDSNLDVEWKSQYAYFPEIVLSVMGSGASADVGSTITAGAAAARLR